MVPRREEGINPRTCAYAKAWEYMNKTEARLDKGEDQTRGADKVLTNEKS